MHQRLHSAALFSDFFPNDDRGGNEIPLARSRNLHDLWDHLLGRQSRMQDVQRELAELKADRELWNVDAEPDIEGWIADLTNWRSQSPTTRLFCRPSDKRSQEPNWQRLFYRKVTCGKPARGAQSNCCGGVAARRTLK
jgi:hypothetical protein